MKVLNFENWSDGELSKIGHRFRKQRDLKTDVIKKCQYHQFLNVHYGNTGCKLFKRGIQN